MRETWHERFADSPDVLKNAGRERTIVPVLDLEIGGADFITMAGPCSVETEFQLLATANHVRRAGARRAVRFAQPVAGLSGGSPTKSRRISSAIASAAISTVVNDAPTM